MEFLGFLAVKSRQWGRGGASRRKPRAGLTASGRESHAPSVPPVMGKWTQVAPGFLYDGDYACRTAGEARSNQCIDTGLNIVCWRKWSNHALRA